MTSGKTIMVAIMDIPYESADSTTALHIIHAALKEGHNVRVFAMEGGVYTTAKTPQSHANSLKETSVEEERQAATKDRAASLFQLAKQHGVKLDWVSCGLSVDDREAGDWPEGLPAVGPKDLVDASLASDATMVILVPTK
jgi:tRNA 2-thiouridine synthesizing protein D